MINKYSQSLFNFKKGGAVEGSMITSSGYSIWAPLQRTESLAWSYPNAWEERPPRRPGVGILDRVADGSPYVVKQQALD